MVTNQDGRSKQSNNNKNRKLVLKYENQLSFKGFSCHQDNLFLITQRFSLVVAVFYHSIRTKV